jgi:hypothetical protein
LITSARKELRIPDDFQMEAMAKFACELCRIPAKHLDAYLDELEHRFNNRHNEFLFRDTLLKLVSAEKLPYRELTKAA